MNTLKTIGLVVVGVVLSVVVSYGLSFHPTDKQGAVIGYLSSLGNNLTFGSFNSILSDLNTLRSPLAGVYASSSASFGVVTLGPTGASTSTASSTLTFTSASGGPFTQGDIIFLGESTTTASVVVTATVINSSTLQVIDQSTASGAGVLPATTTLYVWDVPQSSFKAPGALNTSTSSSQN